MNLEHLEKLGLSPCVAVLDIETQSTALNAVIGTIGCVIKNLFTGKVVDVFYVRCELEEQFDSRVSDLPTLNWWEEQRKEYPRSYDEVFNPLLSRKPLHEALDLLNAFLVFHLPNRPQVVGNGCEFDNAIVIDAMEYFDIKPAWDHGCNQSLRTAIMMGRMLLGIDPKYDLEFEGDKHHALNDAQHEANYLREVFKAFIERLGLSNNPCLIAKEK